VDPYADTVEQYRSMARYAHGESACFEEWASAVAEDEELLGWLGALPPHKRQPNLVFAAARWHGVPAPGPYAGLRRALLSDDGRIRRTVLARSTQTNEVGRLATLVPVLAQVAAEAGRPLALVEAGPSAGLCLYPDRYGYRWSRDGEVLHAIPGTPELACEVTGEPPLPERPPAVAWRGGVDLNPLDVRDEDQMAWLVTLVWPEQDERRRRLHDAIEVARREPPHLVRGDLLEDLPALVERAAEHGPVVVQHSAVVAYLDHDRRARFADLMSGLVASGACRWVSNEGPDVLPSVTATGPAVPESASVFVLGLDGQAVAWTHGHGRSLHWL
jgi:hypothetical protein